MFGFFDQIGFDLFFFILRLDLIVGAIDYEEKISSSFCSFSFADAWQKPMLLT